jgi:hypothetical protein
VVRRFFSVFLHLLPGLLLVVTALALFPFRHDVCGMVTSRIIQNGRYSTTATIAGNQQRTSVCAVGKAVALWLAAAETWRYNGSSMGRYQYL